MIDKIMIWPAILKTKWSTLIGSFTVNITQYALGYLHRSRLQGREPFYFTVWFATERRSVTSYFYSSKISGSQFLENYGLLFCS